MSEQNTTTTLDELFGNGNLDLGGGESDFDPFAVPDTAPADLIATLLVAGGNGGICMLLSVSPSDHR